jgi:hypothetical protein
MLKSCDYLSPEITLYYKNYDRHSSTFSGILTIFAYIIIIILSIIFSLDFLLKTNPVSFFYNKYISDTGVVPFNSTGIFHFIVTGEQEDIDYDDRTFSIIGFNEEYNTILENNSQINFNHWIYSPCVNSDINNLKKYLNDYSISFSKGLCIDKFYNATTKELISKYNGNFEYPLLKHGNSNLNGNTYGIFVLRCQNHSEINKTNCYESNLSDKYALQSLSFSIYFIDSYIDVTNYHYPLIQFYNKIRNQIVLSSFTVNHLNLKPLKLNTHTGIILTKNHYLSSFNFDVNEKLTINQENTGIYGSFYFWMENQVGIYDRTYQKIQDICASISGISKLIMLIGYFLNYPIHEVSLVEDLSNDINKKTEKFGKRTTTRGFTNLNLSNFIKTPNTPQNNKNIISSSQNKISNLNTNNNYNNYISDINISKIKLTPSKKFTFKKNINCFTILKNKFCLKKNAIIQQLIGIRIKVLSEEKLFTSYYIIGSLSDKLLKRQSNLPKIENLNGIVNQKIPFKSKKLYKREMTLNT